MAEVTRVPLQPIRKGSLTKVWLGVVVALVFAALIAWWTVPKFDTLPGGTTMETVVAGEGPNPGKDYLVLIDYVGHLPDGTVFDQNTDSALQVDGVVPGFSEALQHMQKGGTYKLRIPADQAYGEKGGGPIPPNTDLQFDVTMKDFKSREEVMELQRQMQEMQELRDTVEAGQAPRPN